jgi:hypothetical protein
LCSSFNIRQTVILMQNNSKIMWILTFLGSRTQTT